MSFTLLPIVRRKCVSFEIITIAVRQSCNMKKFRDLLHNAQNIVFLTGTGIAFESGLQSYNGPGAVWRSLTAAHLIDPKAFIMFPSLIWEFYHFLRESAVKAQPNPGHLAIAKFEEKYKRKKNIVIITQNIDHLHCKAGSRNVIELNGNLFTTRCTKCNDVRMNFSRPICPALENTGAPEVGALDANIPLELLPSCHLCGCLLRPHIRLYRESVDPKVKKLADETVQNCEICVVISTPSLVDVAKTYPVTVAKNGGIVAEFNTEVMPPRPKYNYYFEGLCSHKLPIALADWAPIKESCSS